MIRAALATAVIAACGAPAGSASEPSRGTRAEVVVIAAGGAPLAPALEALGETLAPGSAVAVVAGGAVVQPPAPASSLPQVSIDSGAPPALLPSIDRAIALLSGSAAPVRAVIVVSDGAASRDIPVAELAERITKMRRAGVLGYSILVAPGAASAIDGLGYTMSRRVVDGDQLRGVAGAIGVAIGSR